MNILEEIQNCPVEWKELGEVVFTLTSPVKLAKKQYQLTGRIPIVDQGEQFIAGYTDNEKYLEKDEYIIFGDHSEHIKFVDFAFVQGADGLKILKPKKGINAKYLYYCICNFYKKEGNYKRHWSNAKITLIPIPPLEIQEKIVQILDKFTDYVTELTSELTSRKKQYSFYRDKLLSFEDEVYQVEWKKLGEVAECLAGATPRTSNSSYWENGTIPWMSSGEVSKGFVYDTEKKITQEGYDSCSTKVVPRDTVVIALAGQGKTRGTVAITKVELCTNQSLCSIVSNDDINSHYLYYYLKGQYQKLRDISSGEGTRGGLNLKMIRDFRIPVPSLKIQSRIVQVLDNFDKVCNGLNIGLPKEIELRQKQYEYFREKLLTFVAEGEYTESRVEEWDNSAIIKLLQWVFGPIRVELGAICDFVRGNGLQKKDFTAIGKSVIHYGQIYTKYDFSVSETLSKTSEIVFETLKKAQSNDLVMATTSENVEDVGKAIVWEGKEEIGISGDSYIIQTTQNSRYLNYWLRSTSFQTQKERKVTGTKVIRINSKDIEKFQIILPSLIEQERIVSILDKFNILTHSLSEGLPKEIEQRQKQYEYWREQLLNFDL